MIYGLKGSQKKFTIDPLFTIDQFTIARFDCIFSLVCYHEAEKHFRNFRKILESSCFTYTVKPGKSKPVNSKQRVNSKLFLAAFLSVYNINHLLNSKLLAIVNLLLLLKKFTIARFDFMLRYPLV